MDGGAWWAAVHGVTKSRTRLSDFTFTFHSHALEKEMATHSSVLAWRIPGTGEPGGLLSMGSHSSIDLSNCRSYSCVLTTIRQGEFWFLSWFVLDQLASSVGEGPNLNLRLRVAGLTPNQKDIQVLVAKRTSIIVHF